MMVKKVHKKRLTARDLLAAGVSKKPVVRKIRRGAEQEQYDREVARIRAGTP